MADDLGGQDVAEAPAVLGNGTGGILITERGRDPTKEELRFVEDNDLTTCIF